MPKPTLILVSGPPAADYAWSQSLGRASIALLHLFTERLLTANVSLIAENNFHREADSA